MADVRVGLAGFGLAGSVFHAPLVEAVDGLELTGIVTRDPERAATARGRYPHAAVVAELDALWGEIDLLVVAAPNQAHVPLARAGVEHGIAVVVDKPLAVTVEDAERLLASARTSSTRRASCSASPCACTPSWRRGGRAPAWRTTSSSRSSTPAARARTCG
jgi:predicted dehydrogenase